jgi:hypothetical protein
MKYVLGVHDIQVPFDRAAQDMDVPPSPDGVMSQESVGLLMGLD